MTELIKKKTNGAIILFAPFFLPIFILGWLGGFVYIYLFCGFKSAEKFLTKLSGFESNNEILERLLNEKLGK